MLVSFPINIYIGHYYNAVYFHAFFDGVSILSLYPINCNILTLYQYHSILAIHYCPSGIRKLQPISSQIFIFTTLCNMTKILHKSLSKELRDSHHALFNVFNHVIFWWKAYYLHLQMSACYLYHTGWPLSTREAIYRQGFSAWGVTVLNQTIT